MNRVSARWWEGPRGETYVLVQIALFALVVFGWRGKGSAWTFPATRLGAAVGGGLLCAGGLLAVAGLIGLGRNLAAAPRPRERAELVATGAYRFVRHPIYSGGILMAFGWALWVHAWPTVGYAAMLALFFDIKARREEQWLREKFPDYAAYQRRVRKLFPFVY